MPSHCNTGSVPYSLHSKKGKEATKGRKKSAENGKIKVGRKWKRIGGKCKRSEKIWQMRAGQTKEEKTKGRIRRGR